MEPCIQLGRHCRLRVPACDGGPVVAKGPKAAKVLEFDTMVGFRTNGGGLVWTIGTAAGELRAPGHDTGPDTFPTS